MKRPLWAVWLLVGHPVRWPPSWCCFFGSVSSRTVAAASRTLRLVVWKAALPEPADEPEEARFPQTSRGTPWSEKETCFYLPSSIPASFRCGSDGSVRPRCQSAGPEGREVGPLWVRRCSPPPGTAGRDTRHRRSRAGWCLCGPVLTDSEPPLHSGTKWEWPGRSSWWLQRTYTHRQCLYSTNETAHFILYYTFYTPSDYSVLWGFPRARPLSVFFFKWENVFYQMTSLYKCRSKSESRQLLNNTIKKFSFWSTWQQKRLDQKTLPYTSEECDNI